MDEGTEVIYRLQELASDCEANEDETATVVDEQQEDFDLTGLFDLIDDFADVPSAQKQSLQIPPPFTVRVVFVYGRSHGNLGFKRGKEVGGVGSFQIVVQKSIPNDNNRNLKVFKPKNYRQLLCCYLT